VRAHTVRELERLLTATATVNLSPTNKNLHSESGGLLTATVHQFYYSSSFRSTEEIKQPLSKKAVTARPLLGGMAQALAFFFLCAIHSDRKKDSLCECCKEDTRLVSADIPSSSDALCVC